MTGGYHSARQQQRDRSLAERTRPPSESSEEPHPTPPEPRPCWLVPAHGPIPGHVIVWHHTPEGWRAMVLVDVDAEQVRPRHEPRSVTPSPGPSTGGPDSCAPAG